MTTLAELEITTGSHVSIKMDGGIHPVEIVRVDDFGNREGMIPGIIYVAPPLPGAKETWVYYPGSNTFRKNDGGAPNFTPQIVVEALPLDFGDFVIQT